MEMHSADAQYTILKSLIHAIRTEDKDTQQHTAHQMIQIAKPRTIKWQSEWKLGNEKPLFRLLKENAHHVDLEWNEDEQAKINTLVERYDI
jgi:hypothetical protein